MPRYGTLLLMLALPGCASPDIVGQRVGQSLYDASVNTGRALSVAGDRAGYALQNAGTNLRNAINPAPSPAVIGDAPLAQPPPHVPDGFEDRPPVTATPLAPAY